MAIGTNVWAQGDYSIALGKGSTTNSNSENSLAALGGTTSGTGSLAIGVNAQAKQNNTFAIGSSAEASETNTIAIGNSASASVAGGVALGSSSAANRVASSGGYNVAENSKTYVGSSQNVWKSTTAAVSVGNGTTTTRQIVGVAAGSEDTDAVNVAQLKLAKTTVQAGNSNAVVSKSTGTDGTTYTVNTYKSVVQGSSNVKVASATSDNGYTTTYTLSVDNVGGISGGSIAYDGNAGTITVTNEDGSTSTITGLKNTYVTKGSLSGNTLTLTRNDNETVEVTGIASTSDKKQYMGDSGTFVEQTLGDRLYVKGNNTSSDLTDGNIGVVSGGDTLTVKLAKDLTGLNSIAVGTVNADTVNAGGNTINSSGITMAPNGKISNLSEGTEGTDAVNLNQLNQTASGLTAKGMVFGANASSQLHDNPYYTTALGAKVMVLGEGEEANDQYDGKNIKTIVTQNSDGDTYIDIKLAKDLEVESVAAQNIKLGDTTITNEGDRISYTTNNTSYQVATTDDGMTYAGDVNSATTKLNKQVKVQGGETDTSNLTDNNIGVVAASDNADGAILTVKLAKDLTGLNTIAVGSGTTITGNSITTGTVNAGGNTINSSGITMADGGKITNLSEGTEGTDAVNLNQLQQVASGEAGKGGFALSAGDNGSIYQDLGSSIRVQGDADPYADNAEGKTGNITTKVINADGQQAIQVSLNSKLKVDTITAGSDGTDGKPGVTLNGTDGAIGMTGTDGTSVALSTSEGVKSLNSRANDLADGDRMSRLTYEDASGYSHTVATMDDGLQFTGDDGKTATRLLGTELKIHGGADKDNLSDNNIGVNYNTTDKQIEVKLAKDLTGLNSAEFSDGEGNQTRIEGAGVTVTTADGQTTRVDGSGITIIPSDGGNAVSLTGAGLDNGGNKITNVAAGVNDTDAVNVWQLNNKLAEQSDELVSKGLNFKGNANADADGVHKNLGETLTIRGATANDDIDNGKFTDSNIKTVTDGNGDLVIMTAKNLTDVDSISLNGATGSNGNPGTTTVTVIDGKPGVDGVEGEDSITRIAYTDPDGGGHQVATLDDGTKYRGDNGVIATRKLNEVLDIKGGAEGALSENNIGVNYDTGSGAMKIQLAKDIKDIDTVQVNSSVTVGSGDSKTTIAGDTITTTTINTQNITVNGSDITAKAGYDGQRGEKGANGVDGTDGTTRIVYKDGDKERQVATMDDGMKYGGDFGNTAAVKLNNTVNIVGEAASQDDLTSGNIGVVAAQEGDNAKLTVKLNKDVNLGNDGSVTIGDTKITNNSVKTTTVNAATVNATTVAATTFQAGDTTINSDGMTINNGPAITKNNVDMGGQQIHNVAAGVADTDAVNVSQMNQMKSDFSKGLNKLHGRISEVDKDASAGVAMALAAASLPQVYLPGKNMMAVAGGTYRGESGFAIGFSSSSDDGKWIIKANATTNSQGHYGAAVGAGYMW